MGRWLGKDGKFSRPPSTALRPSAERNHSSHKKHKASRPWGNDAGIEQLGKADFLFESGRLCSAMDILFLGGFAKVLISGAFGLRCVVFELLVVDVAQEVDICQP